MIIAIDGTSASGKSTVAKMLAEDLNLVNLNSGNLYRALSLAVLNAGADPDSEAEIVAFIEKQDLEMDAADSICLNGKKIDLSLLRTPRIDSVSSRISFYVPVRQKVNVILRRFAQKFDVVCEGRDITSVVFPDTPHKFFIDADVNERARRRTENYNGDFNKVLDDLKKRDVEDYSKPFGALRIVEGATFINSTHKTPREVCDIIMECVGASHES